MLVWNITDLDGGPEPSLVQPTRAVFTELSVTGTDLPGIVQTHHHRPVYVIFRQRHEHALFYVSHYGIAAHYHVTKLTQNFARPICRRRGRWGVATKWGEK